MFDLKVNISYFENADDAICDAEDNDWLTIEDKHYCPNCYKTVKNDDGKQQFVVEEPIPNEVFKVKGVFEKLLKARVNLDWDDNFYYLSYVEYYGVLKYEMVIPFIDYLLDGKKTITEEAFDKSKYRKITLSIDRDKNNKKTVLYRNVQ